MMYSESLVGITSQAGLICTPPPPELAEPSTALCWPAPVPRIIMALAPRPPPIHWFPHVLDRSRRVLLVQPLEALPRSPFMLRVGAVPSARLSTMYIWRSSSKKCHFLAIGAAAERKKISPRLLVPTELRAELGCHVPELPFDEAVTLTEFICVEGPANSQCESSVPGVVVQYSIHDPFVLAASVIPVVKTTVGTDRTNSSTAVACKLAVLKARLDMGLFAETEVKRTELLDRSARNFIGAGRPNLRSTN